MGLVVIPIAGSVLSGGTHGILKDFLIVLNAFSWGAGFLLYISLHAIALYRFIIHRPLPSVLAPTIWINLGPVGAGAISLLSLVGLIDPNLQEITSFACFLLWGLGMWWAVVGTVLILNHIIKEKMEFAMSWWAFTFPLGAFTALCHTLAEVYGNRLLDSIGFFLFWALLFIWVVVFSKSLERNFKTLLR